MDKGFNLFYFPIQPGIFQDFPAYKLTDLKNLMMLNYCFVWKHEPEPQRHISYSLVSYDFLSFIVLGYYKTAL
jgi:hypothetical protein